MAIEGLRRGSARRTPGAALLRTAAQNAAAARPVPARVGAHIVLLSALFLALHALGCRAADAERGVSASGGEAATQPVNSATASEASAARYDTTLARMPPPRDVLERLAQQRGADLRLIDRWLDARTEPPPFERPPLPPRPAEARIAADVPLLEDAAPFADPPAVSPKEVTIRVGIGRSTFRTREPEEVLSAVQPFIDLVQRETDIRGDADLFERVEPLYQGIAAGRQQMALCHVFDYLLIANWLARAPGDGAVPLAYALPARPRTIGEAADAPGVPGAAVALVAAAESPVRSFADLRGRRLALVANAVHGPGTFLTALLRDAGQAANEPYFAAVTLRRYPKDAVIDVLKGKADAACVEQSVLAALARFYGIESRLRVLAVSPRYNVDVIFTSLKNLATHQTEIELTQRQLTTLGKDPEGQEVLFFFDTAEWRNYADGDLDVPRAHFRDFLTFIQKTPVDLRPLLDTAAAVDRRTYDRFGDE